MASAAGFMGAASPLLDLASHFRMHYALVLGVVACGTAALRSSHPTGLFVATMLVNIAVIMPLYTRPAVVAGNRTANSPPPIRLLIFNVLTANRERERASAFVNSSGAHLAFIQEVDSDWLDVLEHVATRYEVVAAEPRRDNYGLALLAAKDENQMAVQVARAFDVTNGQVGLPSIEAHLSWHHRSIAVLGLHAVPPKSLGGSNMRDAQLAAAERWVHAQRSPVVVIGDLNTSPWSASFRSLVAHTGLIDSARGFGYQATWPAAWPALLRIPIDHCLHSTELLALERGIGPELGSDHRAVIVSLAWNE